MHKISNPSTAKIGGNLSSYLNLLARSIANTVMFLLHWLRLTWHDSMQDIAIIEMEVPRVPEKNLNRVCQKRFSVGQSQKIFDTVDAVIPQRSQLGSIFGISSANLALG